MGDENWTKRFFLKLFGRLRDIPAKSGTSRQKSLVPWFRGTCRTFRPPPFHMENPHPTGGYPDPKVWVWVPFETILPYFLLCFASGCYQTLKSTPFCPCTVLPSSHKKRVFLQTLHFMGREATLSTLVARAIRNAIRANRFARIIRSWNPHFYSASGRFAQITRIFDSRESPDSRESCESIRANHATKLSTQLIQKRFCGGNFEITPLKINFDEIFWRHFLPQRLPLVASLHSTCCRITPHN